MPSSFTSNASKNTSNSKRILLVNDEKDVISLFKMVLEMNGFEVDSYTDPLAVLSDFKANSYDLALLDIRMPNLNGYSWGLSEFLLLLKIKASYKSDI
jgi:PleD family two-component response regulator